MKTIASIFTAIVALTLTSCITISGVSERASGPIEERIITIDGDIFALASSCGAYVVVDSSVPRGQVRVVTNSDIFDKLDIKVEESTLEIGLKPGNNLRSDTFEVYVPAYDYNTLAISSGSNFEWEGCSGEVLTIAISAGADAEIDGTCQMLTVAASAGSDADLAELIAESVTVTASAGADVSVYATESLTIAASAGADVSFGGNPKHKDIHTSSGADVYAMPYK